MTPLSKPPKLTLRTHKPKCIDIPENSHWAINELVFYLNIMKCTEIFLLDFLPTLTSMEVNIPAAFVVAISML